MLFGFTKFRPLPVIPALFLALFMTIFSLPAAHSNEAAAIAEVLAKPIVEWIFVGSKSEKAALLMREITSSAQAREANYIFKEFREALTWKDSLELSKVLSLKVNQIEDEFATFRRTLQKEGVVGAKELLSDAEKIKLREIVTRILNEDENLAQLVKSTKAAIERNIPHAQRGRFRLLDGTPDFQGNVPILPNLTESLALDVKALDRQHKGFYRAIAKRIVTYYRLGKALIFTEGEWKSIFLSAGKEFTVNDWALIRRYNIILDALTAKKELELRIFARSQVNRQIELRFNELSREASILHQRGEISDRQWIQRRLEIVKDEKLGIGLTPFEIAAEEQMLKCITTCRKLGGTSEGSFTHTGLINDLERIIENQMERNVGFETAIRNANAKIEKLRSLKRKPAQSVGTDPDELMKPILTVDEINVSIDQTKRHRDRLISLQRENEVSLKMSVSKLSQAYADFYEAYFQLSVFVDARNGMIAGQRMTPIPFPDVVIPAQTELDAWATISDRALQNAIPHFMKGELKLFVATRIGRTRKFFHEFDKAYEKIHGEPFTKSALGVEYQKFAHSFFKEVAYSFLKYVLPPALVSGGTAGVMAEKYADHAVSKWIKAQFGVSNEPEVVEPPVIDAPATPPPVKKPDSSAGAGSRPPIVVTPPTTKPNLPQSPFKKDPEKD